MSKNNWKNKFINLINKISTKKGWESSDINPFFNVVHHVGSTDAETLRQFKKEIKGVKDE
tara:strand:- start:51 stop:230 length:180 start_codon:yes stop_codon:yes gene_type:complete